MSNILMGEKLVDETMTVEKIVEMTEVEFNTWFWQPYGVYEHVSLRNRLTDDTICQVLSTDWFKWVSRSLKNYFYGAFDSILTEQGY